MSRARPAAHPISRPRLVGRLVAARAALVSAPGGYGKSTLASALADELGIATIAVDLGAVGAGPGPVQGALRRAAGAAGLAALAEALVASDPDTSDPAAMAEVLRAELARRTDPALLLVDEAQRATGGGDRLLAAWVAAVPSPHRVVVLGRSIPESVVAAAGDIPRIDAEDLALTTSEIIGMARADGLEVDEVAALALHAQTGGWPAAVAIALRTRGHTGSAARAGLAASVADLLETMGPTLAAESRALARPPLLDETIARLVAAPGALGRVRDAGLPLRSRGDGWLELPEPVREVLAGFPIAPAIVRDVARTYLDAGEVHVAVAWLVGAADPDLLAETLSGRRGHELGVLDIAELRALLSGLPGHVLDRHPRLLVSVARAAEAGVHINWRAELLERAATSVAAAASLEDGAIRREIVAEQAADASRSGEVGRTIALAEAALAGAGATEMRTRAVALTAIGRVQAFSRDPVAMVDAQHRLSEAATLLRPLREPDLLLGTLQTLGYGIHYARGELDAAIAALRDAANVDPGSIRTRAGVQTFLADALVYAGALEEAEAVLREVLGVARRLGDHRLLAYHAWTQAGIASRRGDGPAVEAWLAEAERHPADWFAHPTGIEFLADAVDHLGRVDEHVEAARYLARVEARCAADGREGIHQIALVARAIHGARAGDAVAAERDLVACLSIEQVAPREHWRMHLLRALAAARSGDAPAARKLARRAFLAAEAMGHPELPRVLEAEVTARLVALLEEDTGASVAGTPGGAPRLHVRLLGAFGVTADGRTVDPPEGRPRQLVKLLAVSGRQVPIDEAVEVLWPDVDPDVGRRRLRNVLARIRSVCGELLARDDASLRLEPSVDVDLARFETEATAALSAPGDGQEASVRAALSRYAGELLPGDRYEDYTVTARERAAMRHVALVDRLAALTAARGDIDEALALMADAIDAEPLDEQRYRSAIEVALRHGRRDRARHLVERALAMEAELADEPSPELVALARSMGLRIA